ncbi:hypothetical protein IOD16_30870 [Saccharothrix sp. 6-C]|uniref:hypothetical protein n=1 Tax=Saccharothrix sp. 6-C TaxID=2781735 RepID=UPI001916FF53|nr:hypothetical protein [Saccharothrix sp. 6-C]QQQ75457.1 hypothetical protein IOD16_30870 [Saccharothrix sp. 6-C]
MLTAVTASPGEEPAAGRGDPGEAITSMRVIREVFGLTRDSKEASTRVRQEIAGQASGHGLTWHTIRKHSQVYVEQLSTAIRATLSTLGAADAPMGSTSGGLIPRPDDLAWLHAAYREALAGGGGVITVWGLDGAGKSSLTKRFASEIAPSGAFGFIRLGRRGLFEEDVRQILQLEGVDTTSLSDDHCQALFRTTAVRFSAVRLLVLDDAQKEGDVSALLPHGSNVPVVVTAPRRLLQTDPGRFRQLGHVTVSDTAAYLRQELPHVGEETAHRLAEVLGGHVESMHHVVRYLSSQPAVDANAFLGEITQGASQVLEDLAEVIDAPRSLPSIVRELYGAVHEDALANAILTTVVWTANSGERPTELVVETVRKLGHAPTELQLRAAVLRLERVGLLTSTATSLAVPRLTARILREFTAADREPVLVAYERAIAVPPKAGEGSLLNILRWEYQFLAEHRVAVATALGNQQRQLPALIALDASDWALLMTDADGRRTAEMYRTTPESLLRARPSAPGWEVVDAGHRRLIAGLASKVYPAIKAGWQSKQSI